ncbi:nose resistant to fluoxetine protein 6-like, partial [Glossina fuscipes]|uniref:Nose resistant to fluoxetine protein 6-like n=1 Tax=Glossina fuscipes TaxID=7396 RepID=A0A9C5Z2L8_9MUSC
MLTKVFKLDLIILQVILAGSNIFSESQRNIPTSSYYEMPPLYQFDDYDKCIDSRMSYSYCVVYAEIEPNASSPLWNQIDMYSRDERHHYRHDRLFFGVCVEDCKTLLKSLPDFQQQQLYDKTIGSNEITEYYAEVYKHEPDYHLVNQQLLGKCLNYNFQAMYQQLRLRTSIEYCESSEVPSKIDSLDVVVYSIFIGIGLINILSSFYDYFLHCQQTRNIQAYDHYKENQYGVKKLLTSFSLYRNYYRLLAPSSIEKNELKFINGLRVFLLFCVVMAHSVVLDMLIQTQNPEYFEKFYYNPEIAIFTNGAVIIQIFFFFAGFFLKLKFDELQLVSPRTSLRRCIGVYFKVFLARYLRIVPSLMILILFNGFLLSHMGDGPFWRHITEAEHVFCREYWWQNLFMINNFLLKESCCQHTWFLATDIQLTEFFLIVFILVAKYPQIKRFFLVVLTIASALITSVVTYVLKLEPFLYARPETYRYVFFKDFDTMYQSYVPFYTNLSGYIFGFICAEIYENYVHLDAVKKRFTGSLLYELFFWILFLTCFGLIFSGVFFINHDIEKPSLWIATYAGVYRLAWLFVVMLIVLGMCFKLGSVFYRICSSPLMQPIGRLSFQLYLWHVTVIKILGGFYRQPIYINTTFLVGQIFLNFFISNLIAFVMTLTLEYPVARIIKYFIN